MFSIEFVVNVHDDRCIRNLVGRKITYSPGLDHFAINIGLSTAVLNDLIQLFLRCWWLHHTPCRSASIHLWFNDSFPMISAKKSCFKMHLWTRIVEGIYNLVRWVWCNLYLPAWEWWVKVLCLLNAEVLSSDCCYIFIFEIPNLLALVLHQNLRRNH